MQGKGASNESEIPASCVECERTMATQKVSFVTVANQFLLHVTLRWTRYRQLVLLLSRTFVVLRNPQKGFWLATTLKLSKNLFIHWSILSLNPRILYRGSNGPTLFIPSLQRLRTRIYRKNQMSFWYAFQGAPKSSHCS